MFELWNHQQRVIELNENRNEFALFWDCGTGKTRAMIEILNKKMAREGRFLRTLVLCPLSVVGVWQRELLQNMFINDQLCILDKSGPKRQAKLHSNLWDTGHQAYTGKKVVVMNYEGVILPHLLKILTQWNPEAIICDESHRLKSHSAERSKIVSILASNSKYRYILSGTPILKDAEDLFQQYKILDGGKTFGTNFWAFRNKYFFDKNAGWKSSQHHFPKYEIRPEALAEISKKIIPSSMSVLKKDALDLPPLIRQTITHELSPEARRIYDDIKRDMVSYLNESKDLAAVATIALTKALRFQQVVSGFVKPEHAEPFVFKDNVRLKVLKDLLSDLAPNHKVIVWANFRENYKMIRSVCEDLDIGSVELHGEIPGGERAQNLRDFQENPEVRVMIANQHSGGIGVSMTAASYMIYFSKNFSLEDDIQSEARAHRGGSEIHKNITRIDLVCPGTIDELVNKSLSSKLAIGQAVLQELKK